MYECSTGVWRWDFLHLTTRTGIKVKTFISTELLGTQLDWDHDRLGSWVLSFRTSSLGRRGTLLLTYLCLQNQQSSTSICSMGGTAPTKCFRAQLSNVQSADHMQSWCILWVPTHHSCCCCWGLQTPPSSSNFCFLPLHLGVGWHFPQSLRSLHSVCSKGPVKSAQLSQLGRLI